MNRKGFTLVELLIIIVVISLVASITVFGIIPIFKSAQENSKNISIKSIKEAASVYSSENTSGWHSIDSDSENYYFCVTMQELIYKGLLSNDAIKNNDLNSESYFLIKKSKSTMVASSLELKKNFNLEEFKNYCSDNTDDIVVEIIYDANGGKDAPPMEQHKIYEDISLSSQIPTKEGSTFLGWSKNKDDKTKEYDPGENYKIDSTITLYAVWNVHRAVIRLNTNGGTLSPNNSGFSANNNNIYKNNDLFSHNINYGSSISDEYGLANYNNPGYINIIKNGYTAPVGSEWICLDGDCRGKVYNQETKYNASDFCDASKGDCTVTLGVNWKINNYKITYNLKGGAATNPSSYTIETNSFTLNNPIRIGYTFTGWTGSNGTMPQKTVTIDSGSTGNRSYTANWQDNTSPTIELEIINNSTNTIIKSCSSSPCTVDAWQGESIKLNFKVTDNSSINSAATFKYNQPYQNSLDTNFVGEESLSKKSDNSFERHISVDGNRYFSLAVSDEFGNTTTMLANVKIDTMMPSIEFVENIKIDNQTYKRFKCNALSGVKCIRGYDAINNESIITKDTYDYYWGDRGYDSIHLRCVNNVGNYGKYIYKSHNTSFCGYGIYSYQYVNGFQTTNLCSSSTTVFCGNTTHRKFTDCNYMNGKVFYKQWGTMTKSEYSVEYDSSGKQEENFCQ